MSQRLCRMRPSPVSWEGHSRAQFSSGLLQHITTCSSQPSHTSNHQPVTDPSTLAWSGHLPKSHVVRPCSPSRCNEELRPSYLLPVPQRHSHPLPRCAELLHLHNQRDRHPRLPYSHLLKQLRQHTPSTQSNLPLHLQHTVHIANSYATTPAANTIKCSSISLPLPGSLCVQQRTPSNHRSSEVQARSPSRSHQLASPRTPSSAHNADLSHRPSSCP